MQLGSTFSSVLAFLLLSLALAAGRVRAQEDAEERQAAARALFEQGIDFVDAGDFEQAADRFERSLELRFSPVVAYNLSNALVQLGRYVESSERLREVIRAADTDPQVVAAAETQLEAVLGRIGQLTIRVTGDPESVEVRRDGEELADALLGVTQPVDPGEHTVTLHRNGEELARETVTVSEAGSATVTLEAPPAPEPITPVPSPAEAAARGTGAAGAGGGPAPTGPSSDDGGGALSSPWFWTTAALVVAAGVVAAILLTSGSQADPIAGDFEPEYVELGQP